MYKNFSSYAITHAMSGGLLEPLRQMILRIEVVHHETDPAGDEDQDDRDDFTHKRDGLLGNVDDGEDGQNDADKVNDGTHGWNYAKCFTMFVLPKLRKSRGNANIFFLILRAYKPEHP